MINEKFKQVNDDVIILDFSEIKQTSLDIFHNKNYVSSTLYMLSMLRKQINI